MNRFTIILTIGLAFINLTLTLIAEEERPPNLIVILADDLGYGDLGCFGQQKIQTPHLDQMAAEGMRLTNFYAGSTVCAPSRCVLMTGKHAGQARIRGNGGGPLLPEDLTIAEVLQEAGYATALCGKWGLGEAGTTGVPTKQGFDFFYGYLNQHHAHNYYPSFLWRNETKEPLRNISENEDPRGGGWAAESVDYSHDLIMNEAMDWLDSQYKAKPIFLYLALTIPHANNERGRGLGDGQEVPDYGPYTAKNWTRPNKGQAAMITRMDRDVGRLFAKLKELNIDDNTLVLFTSDNGHHKEGGNDPEFFDANGPLRGMKRDLYEGGIRVPTIARWPGKIAPGTESARPAYFGDWFATACQLAKQPIPNKELPSISLAPTLLGLLDKQQDHAYLYWEFYEGQGKQALRFGRWKAIRDPMGNGHIELYDLSTDLGERSNRAIQRPDLIRHAAELMDQAHVHDPKWSERLKKKQRRSQPKIQTVN